jgi:biopolymer transport protein ExbB
MQGLVDILRQNRLMGQALDIWLAGGWAMIALAINGLILFGIGVHVWLRLKGKRFTSVPERSWRSWIAEGSQRRGAIGQLMDFAMGAKDLEDMRVRFTELNSTELSPVTRDLKFMRRAVSTAPLLGLLGTVTGMLATFHALAVGSGGDKTMDMIAGGISEALITTETGLVIALPGLFLQFHLTRQRERYAAFLAHLETACSQYLVVWGEVARRTGATAEEGRR